MTATHETMVLACGSALPQGVTLEQALGDIAAHMAGAAHVYFVERHVHGTPWKELKKSLSDRFGLTDRQMSSVAFLVDGKTVGIRESLKTRQRQLEWRIASAEKTVVKWEKAVASELARDAKHREWRATCDAAVAAGKKASTKPKVLRDFHPRGSADKRAVLRTKIHHKKRYVADLRQRLAVVSRDIEEGRIRLCFGSRGLFMEQFHLAENGHADHSAWRAAWRGARASEIFCIGSKDETYGSQTASWLGDGKLRLRVPPALEQRFGKHLVLLLKPFRRDGVQARVEHIAWRAGAGKDRPGRATQGLSWRLVRRNTQRGETWVAQVTYDDAAADLVSDARLGAWGIDLNADHLAMTRVDRFGNPVERRTFPLNLKDKSERQIAALLGEAAAWAVATCILPDQVGPAGAPVRVALPLVAERLDFQAKRATLRERGARYARMLSQFAYSSFNTLLDRRACALGVEVRRVNPAFTSVIGQAKFSLGYAMSAHHAAACAIARRGLGFSERVARRRTSLCDEAGGVSRPSGNAFPLPARTRGKHVWSDWRRHSSVLGKARRAARTPVDEAGGRRLRRTDPRGNGVRHWAGRERAARDNRRAAQSRRQPAKPFRWRAVASRRLS